MRDNLPVGGCQVCQEQTTGLARLAHLPATNQLEQFTTAPPGDLPPYTVGVEWLALPCWHTLPSQLDLWDVAVDLWGEDAAKTICAPIPRRVAA